MKFDRNLKFGHYFVIVSVLLISFFVMQHYIIQDSIKSEYKEIVVKYIRKKSLPKRTNFYFGYYYDGNYYETTRVGIKYSIFNSNEETKLIDSLKLGRFYLAKFNNEYPRSIIVNPSSEVTDYGEISLAGFSLDR
jgi:hypothetical protein